MSVLPSIPTPEKGTATHRQKAADWLRDTYPAVQLEAGVVIDGLDTDAMGPVIATARDLCDSRDVPCVIVPRCNGRQESDAKHTEGRTLDFQVHHLDDPQAFNVEMRVKLGKRYCVVLESTHLHVTYHPQDFFDPYQIG